MPTLALASQTSPRRKAQRNSKRQPLGQLSISQLPIAPNSNSPSPSVLTPTASSDRWSRLSKLTTGASTQQERPALSELPINDKSIRLVESMASIRYTGALRLDPTPDNSSGPNSASPNYTRHADSSEVTGHDEDMENDENVSPYDQDSLLSSPDHRSSTHSIYHKSPFPTHPAHILRPGQRPQLALRLDTLNTTSNASLQSAISYGGISTTSAGSNVSFPQSVVSATESVGSTASRPTRRNRSRRSARSRPADLRTDTAEKVAQALAFFSALSTRSEEDLQAERELETLRERSRSRVRTRRNKTPTSADYLDEFFPALSPSVRVESDGSRPTTSSSSVIFLAPPTQTLKGRDSGVRLSDISAEALDEAAEDEAKEQIPALPAIPAEFSNAPTAPTFPAPPTEHSTFGSPGFFRPRERRMSSIAISPKSRSDAVGRQHIPELILSDRPSTNDVESEDMELPTEKEDHTIRMVSSVATFHAPAYATTSSPSSAPSSPNVVVHAVSNSSLASTYSRWKGLGGKISMGTLRDVDEQEEQLTDDECDMMTGPSSPNYVIFGSSSPVLEIHETTETDLSPAFNLLSHNHKPLSIWTGHSMNRDSLPSSPPLPYNISRSGSAAHRYSIGNRLSTALGVTASSPYSGVIMPVHADVRASVLSYVTNTVDTPLSAVNASWASDRLDAVIMEKPTSEGERSIVDIIEEVENECDDMSYGRKSVDLDTLSRLTAPSQISVVSVAVPMPLFFRRSAPAPGEALNQILAHSRSDQSLTTMFTDRPTSSESIASIKSVRSVRSVSSFADSLPDWARRFYTEGKSGVLGLSHMSSSATLARIFASEASLHNVYQAHALKHSRSRSMIIPDRHDIFLSSGEKSPEKAMILSPRRMGRMSNLRACALNGTGTALDTIPSERSSMIEETPEPLSIGAVLAHRALSKVIVASETQQFRNVTPPATATTSASVSFLDYPNEDFPLSNSVSTSVTCSPITPRVSPPRVSTRPSARHSVRMSTMDHSLRTSTYSYVAQPHSPHLPPRSSKRISLWSPPSMERLRFGSATRPSSTVCSPPRSTVQSRRASVLRRLSAVTGMSPDIGRHSFITTPEPARSGVRGLQTHAEEDELDGQLGYLEDVVRQSQPIEEYVDEEYIMQMKVAHSSFVRQLALFVLGFFLPLCWFAAAVISIPTATPEDWCANCSECIAERARFESTVPSQSGWKKLLYWRRVTEFPAPPSTSHSDHSQQYHPSPRYSLRPRPESMVGFDTHASNIDQLDLAMQRDTELGPQVDSDISPEITKLLLKAQWWRMVNRIMCPVGVLLIGAIIGLAVAAPSM